MQQLGFTLIELLISMVLGIVIIGALVVMYTSGSAATRNAQAQGQMNEDAQMALAVITHELRQAGYNPTRAGGAVNDLLQGGWGLFACDTGFTDNTVAGALLTCNAAGNSTSLAVIYEGDLYSGKNTAANLPMDCIGNGVAPTVAGGTYYTMQSRLYIANNALNCNGGGNLNQSQVLAENVESMLVRFAVVEPTVVNSQRVLGYVSAADLNVPGNADLAALPALQRWNKVVAAQVCLVVRSENPVLGEMSNSTYLDCNNANIAIADGRLRRAYRTTVLMRNHGVGYVSN
ncbi:MAG: PilW family protein [Rhodoferax sp.]|nr:PilW family protein [Rhodoferax sp.]